MASRRAGSRGGQGSVSAVLRSLSPLAPVTSPPSGAPHKGRCAQSPCGRPRPSARGGHEPTGSEPHSDKDLPSCPPPPSHPHRPPDPLRSPGAVPRRPAAPPARRRPAPAWPRPDDRDARRLRRHRARGLPGHHRRDPDRRLPLRRPAHRARCGSGQGRPQPPEPGLRRLGDRRHRDAGRHPKARAADVACLALEIVRDAAAASYTTATGDVWTPWKGQ